MIYFRPNKMANVRSLAVLCTIAIAVPSKADPSDTCADACWETCFQVIVLNIF
jgi:hypothetical protein